MSGEPNAGENQDEAAAAALGTRKEQGKAKTVKEAGEGVKADFHSHGADTREKRSGEVAGLVLSSS